MPARAPVAVPIAPPTIAPTGPASAAPFTAPLISRQTEQQEYHQLFFAILSNILTMPEKHHLRTLYRLGNARFSEIPRSDIYVGRPELLEELFRLRRFGLIDEVPGQRIGLIYDDKEVNLADFLRPTPIGNNFVLALPRIENQ